MAEKKKPTHKTTTVKNVTFTVDSKYELRQTIGKGAYGIVCSAVDTSTGKKVAIKKCTNVFNNTLGAKRFLRELKLLQHLKHDNVIGLYDIMYPADESPDALNDIYLVLDLMDVDLAKVISKSTLTDEQIQYLVYQMLCGLKYVHSANVMHRDLKPANILLNEDFDLKICDFGLSRGKAMAEEGNMTVYVVTRWYRAPEILCACKDYDFEIDTWSVGCILAELYAGEPLFRGDDYLSQLGLIFATLGSPSVDDLKHISNPKAVKWIQTQKKFEKIPFTKSLPSANKQAIDLIEKMLIFNPAKRISVDDALKHPFLASVRNVKKETTCPKPFYWEFDSDKALTKEHLRELMWGEIRNFHPILKPWTGALGRRGSTGSVAPIPILTSLSSSSVGSSSSGSSSSGSSSSESSSSSSDSSSASLVSSTSSSSASSGSSNGSVTSTPAKTTSSSNLGSSSSISSGTASSSLPSARKIDKSSRRKSLSDAIEGLGKKDKPSSGRRKSINSAHYGAASGPSGTTPETEKKKGCRTQ